MFILDKQTNNNCLRKKEYPIKTQTTGLTGGNNNDAKNWNKTHQKRPFRIDIKS